MPVGQLIWAAAVMLSLWVSCAVAQEDAVPAEPVQSTGLSLEDLDAAMAEDDRPSVAAILSEQALGLLPLLGFLALALWSFFTKSEWLKYVTLAAAVGYLGFANNNMVSVVDILSVVGWNFPVFEYSIRWYVLGIFAVVSTVLWGRFYCGRVCAFGALTQLMDRIIPSRLRVEPPRWLERRASYIKYAILAFAILYFIITRDNSFYRYIEPFWMFTLSGTPLMWTLLGILLLATVFVRNLYCRFLCPLGAALGVLSSLTVFRIKRWQECQGCKICERACEWGAIEGPKIIKSECVRCDDCERIYADEAACPHWLLLKKRARTAERRRLATVNTDKDPSS